MSTALNPATTLPHGFYSFHHEGVLLGYCPLTGRGVKWLTKPGRSGKAFQWVEIAPGTRPDWRTQVWINSSHQLWHRIVAQHFLNGGKPIRRDLEVDHRKHVDGTAAQDILTNLRIVTKRENQQNQKPRSSRYAGVCWNKLRSKWQANATNPITGKTQYLGLFTDDRESAQAYVDYCQQHGLLCGPAIEALKTELN